MKVSAGAGELALQLGVEREAVENALIRIADESLGNNVVSAAARYALLGGGKRLRPILCIAAYRAAGGATDVEAELYRAAAALELIHTYSLVHDDLPCMDDDDLRRGRPTVHRAHGNAAAVLAGLSLIPLACTVLYDAAIRIGCEPGRAAAAVRELTRGAGAAGMVGGQALDIAAEGCALALEELRALHGRKTGALFAASLRIGAVLAGANAEVRDVLGEFGRRLGLAFQIADDVLDATTDAAVLGKTPGKDAEAAKATFVAQLGVEEARRAARSEAATAVAVLHEAGLESPLLVALAGFAVHRDR